MAETQKKFTKAFAMKILIISIIFYILIFGLFAFWKYHNFSYNALDLAIFNQTFFNTAQGRFFQTSIHPESYLGDHFSPLLLLLVPFYSIAKHPLTLIFFQITAVSFGALPIYLLSKLFFRTKTSLFFALSYLFNPFVQNVSLFEFHIINFYIPLLLFAFYFFYKKKFLFFVVLSFLALLVREDVSFAIVMFSVLAVIEKRSKKWILFPLISIPYFLLSVKIISIFNGEGVYKFLIYYSWLGKNFGEIFKNIFTNPLLILGKLIRFGNLEMLLGFMLPFAFLPFLVSQYLLLALPSFLQIALGAPGGGELILKTQYASLFIPSLFIAFIFAIKKTSRESIKALNFLIKEKMLSKIILFVAVVYSSFTLGPMLSTAKKIMNMGFFDQETKIKSEFIKKTPKNAGVIASYNMLAAVSGRKNVHSLNYVFIGKTQFGTKKYIFPSDAEYMLIDFSDFLTYEIQYKNNFLYKENFQDAAQKLREQLKERSFGAQQLMGNLGMFIRDSPSKILLYETLAGLPKISHPQHVNLENQLEFLGLDSKPHDGFLAADLYWRAIQVMNTNYHLKISLLDTDHKILIQKQVSLAYGLYPTSEWNLGEIVKMHYRLPVSESMELKNSLVSLEVFKIEDGGLYMDADLSTKTSAKTRAIGNPIIMPIIPSQK